MNLLVSETYSNVLSSLVLAQLLDNFGGMDNPKATPFHLQSVLSKKGKIELYQKRMKMA